MRRDTAWISGQRMVPLAGRDGAATWTALGLGDPAANLVYGAWPLDAARGFAVLCAPDRQATLLEILQAVHHVREGRASGKAWKAWRRPYACPVVPEGIEPRPDGSGERAEAG